MYKKTMTMKHAMKPTIERPHINHMFAAVEEIKREVVKAKLGVTEIEPEHLKQFEVIGYADDLTKATIKHLGSAIGDVLIKKVGVSIEVYYEEL